MRRGFTLIEMLIVISIIAILSAMSFAGLMAVRKAAKRSQTILVLNKVDAALRTFRADVGFYPKGAYAFPPVQYETAGFDRGLLKKHPVTHVPISDNDGVWAPGSSPTIWKNGNGLFASLGTAMV